MLKRFWHGQSKSITSAAIILGAASLVSRLLGVLRDRVLAGEFGAGQELDMYYAAFRIPDMVYNLLVLGALSAAFIPVFTSVLNDRKRSEELMSAVFTVLSSALVAASCLLILCAPWLVRVITPGFSQAELTTTTALTRIMLISPIFLGMSGIIGGVLQSHKRFLVYSVSPILYNIGIIIGALFFTEFLGIYGLAFGVIFGALIHMLVQVPTILSLGYHFHWNFNLRDTGLRRVLVLMVPRTMALVVAQVNFFVETVIGSTLAAGSIAIFNLANNIQSFPLGIFAVSFAVAVFPTLSELQQKKKEFVSALSLAIRQVLFLIIPASALLIVLRAQIVRAVLGTGRFDWHDTIITLETLSLFAISLFSQSLVLIVVRAFYARHDSRTPFMIGLIAAISNIGLSLMLSRMLGVQGLALSFSLTSMLNLTLLLLALHYQVGSLDGTRIIISSAKILTAGFMMAIAAQAAKYPLEHILGTSTFVGIATQAFLATFAGGTAYILTCWLLRSEELMLFMESLRKKIKPPKVIPEEILDTDRVI